MNPFQFLIAISILVVPGIFPARRLFDRSTAWLFAPIVVLAACGTGATLSLVLPIPPVVMMAIVILAANGASLRWPRNPVRQTDANAGVDGRVVLVCAVVCTGPQLLGTVTALNSFDSWVTWFLHAEWLTSSRDRFLSAIDTPGYANPAYPPGVSASIAAVWRTLGSTNAEIGQLVVAALTGSTLAFAAARIWKYRADNSPQVTRGISSLEVLLVAASVSAGAFASIKSNGFSGLVDALVATVSLCLMLLVFSRGVGAVPVLVCAVALGLVKNEGLVVVIVLTALCTAYPPVHRFVGRRRLIALWGGLGVGLLWALMVRSHGASSWYSTESVSASLSQDSDSASRAAIATLAVFKQIAGALLVFAACAVLGWRERRTDRSTDEDASESGWRVSRSPLNVMLGDSAVPYCLAAFALLISLVSVSYYVASSYPLRSFLNGSVDRVTMTPKLLLLSAALMVSPSARQLRRAMVPAFISILLGIAVIVQGLREVRVVALPSSRQANREYSRLIHCIEGQVNRVLPAGSVVAVSPGSKWSQRIEAMTFPRYRLIPWEPVRAPEVRVLQHIDGKSWCGTVVVLDRPDGNA